jgi:hypothetical protein
VGIAHHLLPVALHRCLVGGAHATRLACPTLLWRGLRPCHTWRPKVSTPQKAARCARPRPPGRPRSDFCARVSTPAQKSRPCALLQLTVWQYLALAGEAPHNTPYWSGARKNPPCRGDFSPVSTLYRVAFVDWYDCGWHALKGRGELPNHDRSWRTTRLTPPRPLATGDALYTMAHGPLPPAQRWATPDLLLSALASERTFATRPLGGRDQAQRAPGERGLWGRPRGQPQPRRCTHAEPPLRRVMACRLLMLRIVMSGGAWRSLRGIRPPVGRPPDFSLLTLDSRTAGPASSGTGASARNGSRRARGQRAGVSLPAQRGAADALQASSLLFAGTCRIRPALRAAAGRPRT